MVAALAVVLLLAALGLTARSWLSGDEGGRLYDQAVPIAAWEDQQGEVAIERIANLALSNINCMAKRPPGSRAECRQHLVDPGSALDGDIDHLIDSGELGDGSLRMSGLAGYSCCGGEYDSIIDIDIAGEGRHLKVVFSATGTGGDTTPLFAKQIYWIDD